MVAKHPLKNWLCPVSWGTQEIVNSSNMTFHTTVDPLINNHLVWI